MVILSDITRATGLLSETETKVSDIEVMTILL